ncbi:NAD(P)H-binding protein [Sinomonas halotolerans]|uniref:NAD(P)H-binding protein n=1 Tax=Sinomonas halotolerans TaxID=1644133 RepID=A0ABU9X4R1_9MICC
MNPSPSPTLAIAGVTGTVGGHVAHLLSEAGLPLTLLARRPAKAPELPHAVVPPADYGERALCEQAPRGVEVLFVVSGRRDVERLTGRRPRTLEEVLRK